MESAIILWFTVTDGLHGSIGNLIQGSSCQTFKTVIIVLSSSQHVRLTRIRLGKEKPRMNADTL